MIVRLFLLTKLPLLHKAENLNWIKALSSMHKTEYSNQAVAPLVRDAGKTKFWLSSSKAPAARQPPSSCSAENLNHTAELLSSRRNLRLNAAAAARGTEVGQRSWPKGGHLTKPRPWSKNKAQHFIKAAYVLRPPFPAKPGRPQRPAGRLVWALTVVHIKMFYIYPLAVILCGKKSCPLLLSFLV